MKRTIAVAIVFAGAVSSLGFLLARSHRPYQTVVFVVATWVVSPFVGLAVMSRQRSGLLLASIVTAATVLVYAADAVRPFRPQAAFAFVLVPALMWTVLVVVSATLFLRRRPDTSRR
jgi:hypothetical protein